MNTRRPTGDRVGDLLGDFLLGVFFPEEDLGDLGEVENVEEKGVFGEDLPGDPCLFGV